MCASRSTSLSTVYSKCYALKHNIISNNDNLLFDYITLILLFTEVEVVSGGYLFLQKEL